jgi:hypothetical protein
MSGWSWRKRRDELRRGWIYPTDVEGFLQRLGTSSADPHEAKIRVGFFLMGWDAPLMPRELRAELMAAGLLNPRMRTRPAGGRNE